MKQNFNNNNNDLDNLKDKNNFSKHSFKENPEYKNDNFNDFNCSMSQDNIIEDNDNKESSFYFSNKNKIEINRNVNKINNQNQNLKVITNQCKDNEKIIKDETHFKKEEININLKNKFLFSMSENDINEPNKFNNNNLNNKINKIDTVKIFDDETEKELDEVIENREPVNFNFTKINNLSNAEVKILNLNYVLQINIKLNYPETEPLWYIYHPIAKSSFGPVSSKLLCKMYNNKLIDGNTEVRFIDIFKLHKKAPFAFFQLKQIEMEDFINEIEESTLLKYIFNLNKAKIELNDKKNNLSKSKENLNKIEIINDYNDYYEPNFDIKHKIRNSNIEFKEAHQDRSKKFNLTQALNEDEEIDKAQDISGNKNLSNNSKTKGGKFKKKGRPVDFEGKTGFYTVTQQEKDFESIYILQSNKKK